MELVAKVYVADTYSQRVRIVNKTIVKMMHNLQLRYYGHKRVIFYIFMFMFFLIDGD